jgi:hypothetical protein
LASSRPGRRAAFYRESGIRRAGELRAAGAPLRAIQAALQTEHGERVSLDALARMVREAA